MQAVLHDDAPSRTRAGSMTRRRNSRGLNRPDEVRDDMARKSYADRVCGPLSFGPIRIVLLAQPAKLGRPLANTQLYSHRGGCP